MVGLKIEDVARAVNRSRLLWEGSGEAPAVREIAFRLSELLAGAARHRFIQACGYLLPQGEEDRS